MGTRTAPPAAKAAARAAPIMPTLSPGTAEERDDDAGHRNQRQHLGA